MRGNDFKNQKTLLAVVTHKNAYAGYSEGKKAYDSGKFELDKMTNAAMIATTMVLGTFNPMLGMEGIYQNRAKAWFEKRFTPNANDKTKGTFKSDGRTYQIYGVRLIGDNYFFGGYND